MNNDLLQKTVSAPAALRLRLGFLGVGWIGRNRMEAMVNSSKAEARYIVDPVNELALTAKKLAPKARVLRNLKELLDKTDVGGIVIATPSALHAEETIMALQAGKAVFCQKPLGRNKKEVMRVIEAARKADRLLGVDLSYRFLNGIKKMKEIVSSNGIGHVYAADLVFHNAYGPDKEWFYNPQLSGGGCVMDLGIHLIDLALWMLDYPQVEHITSRLFAKGRAFKDTDNCVEDYATARIDLESDTTLNLSCSWRQSAGRDAVIEASFYGTEGGLSLKNLNGTFYDFKSERYRWTAHETLSEPPEDWGPKAALNWIEKMSQSTKYDSEIEQIIKVSEVIDRIYGRNNM
ncbi:MAG: Gfo/Idh/MocA family protein [Bacteroidota bacterium]|jgi:predicted dehydrogenase|nr:Gfo/Idh/MocA family oxidoreductase [Ignavibacteria bacterium]MCU7498806.1 Gfo/Idh/MocA family oxidoreductase [Ignavibacteria bacterium]MCU7512173.1 Gfo/Idh/MocA family oxidoreductase [Ignavibacteria bacterium]MCU7520522.1 Gfo/Idh/MocA family oxidoreductase [Ignavibacteria bacterium]MCU7523998.1 Gfo/Idh/MocA family oxidoreductase [Ignavibacteria bacterium]